jgi:hypothetical protein
MILFIEIVSSSNGHSHLQTTLLGPSVTVPISDGKLVLGNWQQIFHLECAVRGRERTIVVTLTGDEGQSTASRIGSLPWSRVNQPGDVLAKPNPERRVWVRQNAD